jgi:hypothetical protein
VSIKNQELNYGQGDTKDLEASDLGLDDSWFYVI